MRTPRAGEPRCIQVRRPSNTQLLSLGHIYIQPREKKKKRAPRLTEAFFHKVSTRTTTNTSSACASTPTSTGRTTPSSWRTPSPRTRPSAAPRTSTATPSTRSAPSSTRRAGRAPTTTAPPAAPGTSATPASCTRTARSPPATSWLAGRSRACCRRKGRWCGRGRGSRGMRCMLRSVSSGDPTPHHLSYLYYFSFLSRHLFIPRLIFLSSPILIPFPPYPILELVIKLTTSRLRRPALARRPPRPPNLGRALPGPAGMDRRRDGVGGGHGRGAVAHVRRDAHPGARGLPRDARRAHHAAAAPAQLLRQQPRPRRAPQLRQHAEPGRGERRWGDGCDG